jgi:hypothetical protein
MADDFDVDGAMQRYLAQPTPEQGLRLTLQDAVGKNPDQAAEWRKTAATIGVPVDSAATLPDWSKNQKRLADIDTAELALRNPVTTTFLTEPTNAEIAHDDTANMGLMETLANSFRRGVPALQQALAGTSMRGNQNALAQFDAVVARIDGGEDPGRILASDDPMGAAYMTPAQRAAFRAQITTPLAGNIATVARAQAEQEAIPQPQVVADVTGAKTFREAFSAFAQDPVTFIAAVGPQSLVSQAPFLVAAIPAGIAGGVPGAAATLGAGSFATDYGASIVEGLTQAGVDVGNPAALQAAVADTALMQRVAAGAMAHAAVVGTVDAASGGAAGKLLLPARALAGRPVAREVANLAVQTPVQGVLGGVGEAGGQIAAGQEIQPGAIVAEIAGEFFGAPTEVATMAAGQVRERMQEATAAEASAVRVEELAKLVEASKLRERAPATFQAFVDQLAEGQNGNPSELYIDAQTLVETLNQSGVGMAALQAVAPSVAEQLNQATFMPGADIRLPVSELLSAPTEVTQPLIDHLRAAPDAMSRQEAKTYLKQQDEEIRKAVDSAMTGQEQRTQFMAEVQTVRDHFQAELDLAGKFRPEVNKAYATLLGNFYATQAARAGVPLSDFMDRYALQVRAQTPQRSGAQTVDQGPAETKIREAWSATPNVSLGKPTPLVIEHNGVTQRFLARQDALGKGKNKSTIHLSVVRRGRLLRGDPEGWILAGYKLDGKDNLVPEGLPRAISDEEAETFNANFPPQQTLEQSSLPDRLIQTQATDKDGTAYDLTITRTFTGANRDTPQVLVEARTADGNRRGMVDFSVDEDGTLRAELARVAPQFQRKGLASAMYRAAQEAGYSIAPGRAQTEAGAGMVSALQSQGVVGAGAITPTSEYQQGPAQEAEAYPAAKGAVDGLEVREKVPNMGSISASLDDYTVLEGVREVPMSAFADPSTKGNFNSASERERVARLAAAIAESGEINPLIVVIDNEGAYVLEGGHRLSALHELGKTSIPALVVLDNDSLGEQQTLEQRARGTLSFSPDITAAPSVIALLEGADLSTFIHEAGHFFLEVQADMAARIAAKGDQATEGEQQILADFNRLLTWFGITGTPDQSALTTWLAMSTDERREHHEQFARSFEKYVGEGQAPSQELAGVFQRFRSWLLSVYQTLTSLNSKLDNDVRAVMDRMLASDAAITATQAARGMGPLFQTPEQAGMTPEEYTAYQSLGAAATASAQGQLDERLFKDMKWLSGARSKALKAAQAQADAQRNAIEAQVRAEVMDQPVYRAWNFLTGKPQGGEQVTPGLTAVEDIDTEQDKGKLRTSLVKEADPAAYDILSAHGMTSENRGMHPDIVAEMFGYASGDAMIQELARAQAPDVVIEGMTDQRMLEEYGDITSPAALNRAADEAVHNELRARVIAAELAALTKATRVRGESPNEIYGTRRNTVDVMARAAKDYATQVIARIQLKNLRPKQYTAAEARSARLAVETLGNTAEAAMHKRNQLVNNYAAKEAFAAQDEVRKENEFFKRVLKGNAEEVSKTRDFGIVQAARAVLAEYGIGTKGESATSYIDTLAKNDPDMHAIIAERTAALVAGAKPAGELTVEEFRGLAEEIHSLWFLAKRTRQVEIDGKLMDREQVQGELTERMVEIGIPATIPGEGRAVTDAERWRSRAQTLGAALRRVETWVGVKDGEDIGAFRRYIWQPVKEAADRYRADKAKVIKQYKALLDTLQLGKQRIEAPELGYTFGFSKGGSGKAEILHAILHTGNESNKRKLLLGRKWATENADGTLDTRNWDLFIQRMIDAGTLTKADYDFAQGVWDLLESTKPLAQKAHRDVFGHYFAEVTANEFTTPFGTYRGGYVPAMADPEVVKDAATRKLQEDENSTLAYAFPSTAKGFTKARVEYNRPLLLDLRTLATHLDKVLLFSHLEQPVRDVRRILSAPGVSTPLHRIDPQAYDGLLTPWLNRAARQTVEAKVPGDNNLMRGFSLLRQRAGMAAMFANVSNTVQQLTGFSLAALKVRPKYLMDAMAQYTIAPRQMTRTVAASSTYMDQRLSNETGKMENAINEILLNPSVYGKAVNWTAQHTYFLQSAVDNVMSPIIWTGAYNQALEAGHSDADAVRLADSTIRETQGSTLPEDVSRIETGNSFVRLFTQFAGYFNMQANLMQGEFAKMMHSLGLRKGMGRGLYIFAFGFLVPNIVAETISQAFKGGPDDEDKDGDTIDDWLWATLLLSNVKGALAMVPVVGQTATAVVASTNDKPYDDRISTSPAISMVESATQAPRSIYEAAFNGGDSRKAVRDLATLLAITVGLPATAIARPLGYTLGVSENRIAPTSAADAARGLVTGTPSPESKR